MSISLRTLMAATLALGFAGTGLVTTAHAETKWQATHPRRTEVNTRLARQNYRIHQQVKDGDLSKSQAATLHTDDHDIRQEERLEASQNGGHITKLEQAGLNQQENAVSRDIGH